MRTRDDMSLSHWKTRLRAFQRAWHWLFSSQHNTSARRIQIKAHNVPKLRFRLRIIGEFERARAVRLQIVGMPTTAAPPSGINHCAGAMLRQLQRARPLGGRTTSLSTT